MNENNPSTPPPDDPRAPLATPDPNDEIDLVDLGVSLWRRWKLMLIIFLACTGLGLVFAFVLPRVSDYSYTAVVEIGSYVRSLGKIAFVMTPNSAAETLNSGLIQSALLRYASEHHVDPRKINIVAKVPGKSSVVVLTGKGSRELQDAFETVEKNAATLLAGLNSVQETRLIVPPARSIKPTGHRKVVVILAAVAGVMLALLAVALADYVAAVRRRLSPEEP